MIMFNNNNNKLITIEKHYYLLIYILLANDNYLKNKWKYIEITYFLIKNATWHFVVLQKMLNLI